MTQQPLFEPNIAWQAPNLSDLPEWPTEPSARVAIDVETKDTSLKDMGIGVRRGGFILGVSFSIEDGPDYYLPIAHPMGGNVDNPDMAVQYLKDQAQKFKGLIVGANLQYDLDYLEEIGIKFPNVRFFRDVTVADPLLYELHYKYSLQSIAERLGIPGKTEELLKEGISLYGGKGKGDIWRLPARYVGQYAEQDTRLPLKVLRLQERRLDEKDLWGIYDLESKVLPVLVKMRRRGVAVNMNRLDEVVEWSKKEEKKQLGIIRRETGVDLSPDDVWNATAMSRPLEKMGVSFGYGKDGQPSIDADFLKSVGTSYATAMIQARKVNKLRTTFAESIRRYAVNGRVHTSFNQLKGEDESGKKSKGARTGRLSSEHPNFQQQPSRDSFAVFWRSIYMPDGEFWAACDYSQQEPRILTHYAEATRLEGAFAAAESYRKDPETDSHAMMTKIVYGQDIVNHPDFKEKRTYCKTLYLGKCYGMGNAKLARKLKLPTYMGVPSWADENWPEGRKIELAGPEAMEIINRYDEKVPFVKRLAKETEKAAKKRGWIRTLLGRKINFPEEGNGFGWTYKALNSLIQGSAADQTKAAMVAADEAGFSLQLQVHDEIDLSVSSVKEAEELSDIMANCVTLRVPSKVDVELGSSWGMSMVQK